MTEEEFIELIDLAKRGQAFTTGDLSPDAQYALTRIATARRWTQADIENALAAYRGESPFDDVPLAELS